MPEETIVETPAEAVPASAETPVAIEVRTPLDEVQFDFMRITARQAHELGAIIQGNDIPKKAEIFALLCTAVPEEWGAPDSIDTFLDLPLWGENGFRAVQTRFIDLFSKFGDPTKN